MSNNQCYSNTYSLICLLPANTVFFILSSSSEQNKTLCHYGVHHSLDEDRLTNKYIIYQTEINFMEKNKASWGTGSTGESSIILRRVVREGLFDKVTREENECHEITSGYSIPKNSKCPGLEVGKYAWYCCGTIWSVISQGEESKVRFCGALWGCELLLWVKWEKLEAFEKSHSDYYVEGEGKII